MRYATKRVGAGSIVVGDTPAPETASSFVLKLRVVVATSTLNAREDIQRRQKSGSTTSVDRGNAVPRIVETPHGAKYIRWAKGVNRHLKEKGGT